MRKRFIAGGFMALALAAAGCSSGADAAPATGDQMDTMAMGDRSLTAAVDVTGAEVASGEFALLDTAPFGFDRLDGTAWLARHSAGTTVTVELNGLLPNSPFIAHVHAGRCVDGGGRHYQFDSNGGPQPPNEIHLRFSSDGQGTGFMTGENAAVAGPEAQSVVVHPNNMMDAKVGCADLR